jgi:hypothetical protein
MNDLETKLSNASEHNIHIMKEIAKNMGNLLKIKEY